MIDQIAVAAVGLIATPVPDLRPLCLRVIGEPRQRGRCVVENRRKGFRCRQISRSISGLDIHIVGPISRALGGGGARSKGGRRWTGKGLGTGFGHRTPIGTVRFTAPPAPGLAFPPSRIVREACHRGGRVVHKRRDRHHPTGSPEGVLGLNVKIESSVARVVGGAGHVAKFVRTLKGVGLRSVHNPAVAASGLTTAPVPCLASGHRRIAGKSRDRGGRVVEIDRHRHRRALAQGAVPGLNVEVERPIPCRLTRRGGAAPAPIARSRALRDRKPILTIGLATPPGPALGSRQGCCRPQGPSPWDFPNPPPPRSSPRRRCCPTCPGPGRERSRFHLCWRDRTERSPYGPHRPQRCLQRQRCGKRFD